MQELSHSEAHEFLNEFIYRVFLAARAREARRIELEREVRKISLIERQFPSRTASPHKDAKPPVPQQVAVPVKIIKTGVDKIDALLTDPSTDLIECSEGVIKIRKEGSMHETGFIVNEKEAEKVIKKFSEESKIPIVDKLLHASVGKMKIDAIISRLIGSRFLITKNA